MNRDEKPMDFYRDIPVPFAVFEVIFDSGLQVKDTRYIYVNEAYCRMAGIDKEALIGRRFMEVYPGESRWFPYCMEALEKNAPVHDCFYSNETGHWLDFTVKRGTQKDTVSFIFVDFDDAINKEKRERITSSIILRISKILNNEETFNVCMDHTLAELSQVIHPDRLYILETDGRTISNTFEWCAGGVTAEIDTLQNLDYQDYVGGWEKYLEKDTSVVIPDIEELKDDDPVDYENLRRQGIRRVINAPFYNNGKIIGFLGVDNYELNDFVNTKLVLETISYFIGAKIVNHRLLNELDRMSYIDNLTGVHNRNALIKKTGELSNQMIPVGLVYADINGLKRINDHQGHFAGDEALRYTANLLTSVFQSGNVYRAGGDEFVVLLPDIKKEEFASACRKLPVQNGENDAYHIAFGFNWCEDSREIIRAIQMADKRMYAAKAEYYRREIQKF